MYLRISRTRVDPARFDEAQALRQDVVLAVRRLPGCQSVYQCADRSDGTGAVVSLWDTPEHARFSRETLGELMARTQALGVQVEPPEIYEVLAQA